MRILVFTVLLLFTSNLSKAQEASEILATMDKVLFSPKDKSGIATITLIDKTGAEKVREAEFFQKGPHKKLYRYTKPESQAGIATLTLPDNVVWLSLPAFEKPKRISLLSKSQAFNNTDFSYEDMATTPYSERFTPELTSTGANDYVLELTPISGKSKYTKIILRMHKQNAYPISMLYYNEQNRLFKEATYTYEKVGKYWNAKEVIMKNIEKDHSTVIQLSDIKFDQGLSDDLFTIENLKK